MKLDKEFLFFIFNFSVFLSIDWNDINIYSIFEQSIGLLPFVVYLIMLSSQILRNFLFLFSSGIFLNSFSCSWKCSSKRKPQMKNKNNNKSAVLHHSLHLWLFSLQEIYTKEEERKATTTTKVNKPFQCTTILTEFKHFV